MDPLTCLSLATSIIQITDFGCGLVKHGYQVYKTGSTKENAEVGRVTEGLKRLTVNLSETLASAETVSESMRQEELMLQHLAENTAKTAGRLIELLDTSTHQDGTNKRRTTTGQILKSLVYQPKVADLVKKLETYRNELVLRVVVSLKLNSELHMAREDKRFDALEESSGQIASALLDNGSFFTTGLERLHKGYESEAELAKIRHEETVAAIAMLKGADTPGSHNNWTPKVALGPGESLKPEEYLLSGNRRLRFLLQTDGNLVLYHGTRVLWATCTHDIPSYNLRLTMCENGSLELHHINADGSMSYVHWSSNTAASNDPNDCRRGASLVLQEDGNAVVLGSDGVSIIWESGTKALWPPYRRDRLQVGEGLYPDDSIVSPNKRYKLIFQTDANLVLYDGTRATWAIGKTDAEPRGVTLGDDDDLVVNRDHRTWKTGTRRRLKGGRGALIVRDDGAAVIESDDTIIWSTNPSLVQPYEPVDLVQFTQGSDILRPGEYLAKGQWLSSPNGTCNAILQDDGNFVIYRQTNPDDRIVLWASATMSNTITRLCFGIIARQLNLYGAGAQVQWSPQGDYEFAEDHVLRMGDDGNLAILPEWADPYDYSGGTHREWSTGTVVCDPAITTNSIETGQILLAGQELVSSNGKYVFSFTKLGEICVSSPDGNTPTVSFMERPYGWRGNAVMLAFHADGHIEPRNASGGWLWRAGPGQSSQGSQRVKLVMRDDGHAVIQTMPPNEAPGEVHWWVLPNSIGDRLATSQVLWRNQRLRSPNGTFEFVFQSDGNLVVYKHNNPNIHGPSDKFPLWASNSWGGTGSPHRTILQSDGNLVVYDKKGSGWRDRWASGTSVDGGGPVDYELVMQDDGNAVLYDGNRTIWATGTAGR